MGELYFQGIGMMVLSGTDHDEELGALQVRPTEFPEGATNGVNHPGRHVHGTKTTMCGIIRGAILLGK